MPDGAFHVEHYAAVVIERGDFVVVADFENQVDLGAVGSAGNDDGGYWLIGAIAAISGLLMQGAFDTIWYRPPVSTLWWLLLAIIASFYTDARQKYRDAVALIDDDGDHINDDYMDDRLDESSVSLNRLQ